MSSAQSPAKSQYKGREFLEHSSIAAMMGIDICVFGLRTSPKHEQKLIWQEAPSLANLESSEEAASIHPKYSDPSMNCPMKTSNTTCKAARHAEALEHFALNSVALSLKFGLLSCWLNVISRSHLPYGSKYPILRYLGIG